MNLKDSIDIYVNEEIEYFRKWTFEKPIVINEAENIDYLKDILFKLIHHFVDNYLSKYSQLMPVSSKVFEILTLLKDKPYNIGTYRTDFVYDRKDKKKIIEISCRCSLNAMLMSSVFNKISRDSEFTKSVGKEIKEPYGKIINHLEGYLKKCDSVYVLQGIDKRNESKIFKKVFDRIDKKVIEIGPADIKDHIDNMTNSWIITELSFDEIISIPTELIKKLIHLDFFNDLRTVFLVHDKRFFSVLRNLTFLQNVLSQSEIDFFKKYYPATYSNNECPEIWNEAISAKSKWIIKAHSLGNGEEVYAGITTNQNKWEILVKHRDAKGLILQEYVEQKTYKGVINNREYNDYITGTFLFFDEHYFGLGPFRTSSIPVANQIDHRKASALIIANN